MRGSLDGRTLRRAMQLFAESLREHREEIDSLNVFPVPDGDTGTNLLLTQESVERALSEEEGTGPGGLRSVGDLVSRASLMGARGNSGVILSQSLRGLCEALPAHDEDGAGPAAVAAALVHASSEADRSVASPVEGTVLTVLRDAAAVAEQAAGEGADLPGTLNAALAEARASLARTPDLLPELGRAGVVDAGGKGMVLLFDALLAAVRDEAMSEPLGPRGPVGRYEEGAAVASSLEFGFEVQYLLEAPDVSIDGLRRALGDLGGSLALVGGGGLFNVHVHTNEPGKAVEAGMEAGGRPREISIVDLEARVARCADAARGAGAGEPACSLVAVAEGDGIVRAFRSLGALVVRGGPARLPAASDLIAAIEAAPSKAVVVLPNHRDVVAGVGRAAAAAAKSVGLVAALSVPAGLAAAATFAPMSSLQDNMTAMIGAVEAGRAGEVARSLADAAGRDPAWAGEWIGVADGEVQVVGHDALSVTTGLTRKLMDGLPKPEVVTLVVGDGIDRPEGEKVVAAVRSAFPDVEVEVLVGGQPSLDFLVGVE